MQEHSIHPLFEDACRDRADEVAYRYKRRGQWHALTWRQQYRACQKIAKSMIALGVQKGDKVNIISSTRLEWVQCDFAAMSIGAATVGIYPTLLQEDCAFIINHSECTLLFVENQEQLDKILAVRADLPTLRHIVLYDSDAGETREVMSWETFIAKGHDRSEDDFRAQAEAVSRDDLAAIVYTSGTTGVPKGAMLTHENFLFTSWAVLECLTTEEKFETILFLPLAHAFARIIVFTCMRKGIALAFAESLEKVAENIRETRPHFFASVPRIYEKVYEKITHGVDEASAPKRKLFHWALKIGYAVSDLQQRNQPVPKNLARKHRLADKLVFKKIRTALGGRLQFAISGAAPLSPAIAEFFHACGILLLEGYGMTESTSFSHVNRIEQFKFGFVGPPGPEIEHRIDRDGEILVRGKIVMRGYFKNPAATEEAIDSEGWLHTGDVGEIDTDNFLKITDRKKDIIITAGGKNIAPQRVERTLRASKYINQAVALGDKKKYLTALLTLDQPQVETWATAHGIEFANWHELTRRPEVEKLITAEVATCNQSLASFETIKRFAIIPEEFSITSGELTPTLKMKRKVIAANYRNQIESLYEDENPSK